MNRLPIVVAIILLVLWLPVFCSAQTQCVPSVQPSRDAGSAENGITARQGDQILQELKLIRQLLVQGAARNSERGTRYSGANGQTIRLNVSGMNVIGRADAPLTIIEFADYQCSFCRTFNETTFKEIKKNWIDTGRAKLVLWDFPLPQHKLAMKAAQAVRCAASQGKFLEMHDLLFTDDKPLTAAGIVGYGSQIKGLKLDQFTTCVEQGKFVSDIQEAVVAADRQGVSATPSFVIGKTNGDVVEGQKLVGGSAYVAFERTLNQLLVK